MQSTRLAAALVAIAAAGAAMAQGTGASQEVIQRQANQQQRVEAGLKDGSLNVKEAGRIEKSEAGLDRIIARDQKNGISPKEQAQINARENAISNQIQSERNNGARGNPASAGSQRMQADVQRNVNQDERIQAGVKDGQLSAKEVSALERGQAKVDRKEARVARNGKVGAGEQARVQRAENRQSRRIKAERHDR
jgi:hypothetical protein